MILHHFRWRSSKIILFWPKTLIFNQKFRKYPKNSQKYQKFLGFLGFLGIPVALWSPVEPCGALWPCGATVALAERRPKPSRAQEDCELLSRHRIKLLNPSSKSSTRLSTGVLHRGPPQGSLGNPRKPWIFGYFSRFLRYFLDFLSNIRVFG